MYIYVHVHYMHVYYVHIIKIMLKNMRMNSFLTCQNLSLSVKNVLQCRWRQVCTIGRPTEVGVLVLVPRYS